MMQAKLQEIRERAEKGYFHPDNDGSYVGSDIKYLLDALEQAQEENYNLLEKITDDCLMCDKMDMAMLQSENEGLKNALQGYAKIEGVAGEIARQALKQEVTP